MHNYSVAMEIAGPAAIFARPDCGGTPVSYPAPTYSACKGMFESIAWIKGSAWIRPLKVQICKRVGASGGEIRYQQYTNNYGGPLRKSNQLRLGASFQLNAHILIDVCFRIFGEVIEGAKHRDGAHVNVRHYLMDLFKRRLRQGRCYRTPCLGWSEFTASYWGPFREDRFVVDEAVDGINIPSMLGEMWDRPVAGNYAPCFRQNLQIKKGVLSFA